MIKKYIITFGIITILALGTISCENNAKSEAIKIGVIIPLTGDAASYGKSLQNGLLVALNQYNSKQEKKLV